MLSEDNYTELEDKKKSLNYYKFNVFQSENKKKKT